MKILAKAIKSPVKILLFIFKINQFYKQYGIKVVIQTTPYNSFFCCHNTPITSIDTKLDAAFSVLIECTNKKITFRTVDFH